MNRIPNPSAKVSAKVFGIFHKKDLEVLRNNSSITYLDIRYRLDPNLVDKFCNILVADPVIQVLSIDIFWSRESKSNEIIQILRYNKRIKAFYLNDSTFYGLDDDSDFSHTKGLSQLGNTPLLASNTTLVTLDLRISMDNVALQNLSRGLELNTSLTSISLSKCKIDDVGLNILGKSLLSNSCIKFLCLNENKAECENCDDFLQCLRSNKAIELLSLGKNQISEIGASKLFQALSSNHCIHTLYLHENLISSIEIIVEPLLYNQSLTTVDISGNNDSRKTTNFLSQNTAVLGGNLTLKEFFLGWNHIGDDGIKILSNMLKNNLTLTKLHLEGNEITNDGMKYLAKALNVNKSLQLLSLHGNEHLTDEGYDLLMEPLIHNHTLRDITRFEIGSERLGIRSYLLRNVGEAKSRRIKFQKVVITLALESKASSSHSEWKRFPLEIRFHIASHFFFKPWESIGRDPSTIFTWVKRVFEYAPGNKTSV
jgi:hypothetical protein